MEKDETRFTVDFYSFIFGMNLFSMFVVFSLVYVYIVHVSVHAGSWLRDHIFGFCN